MNKLTFSFSGKTLTTQHFSIELDYPIQDVLPLEEGTIVVVLYDRDSNIRRWGQFPNLICLSDMGKQLWTAELPTTDTGDSYFEMRFENHKLWATSWRSFDCEIDIHTGKIKSKIFTK